MMTPEQIKLREQALDKYIREKHTQDECIGFIEGFEKAIEMLNQ